jgi:two-component system sensor histidine kinase/response regulator
MLDEQKPKELLLREINTMRQQLTALKATEVEYKKLKRDSECFSLLSHEILCIIEIDGSFAYLNHATEKILGFTQDELLLKPFVSLIHPLERKLIIDELKKLSSGMSFVSFTCRCFRKYGSFRWITWTMTYVAEEELFYGVAQDITSYKEAEEAVLKFSGNQKQQMTQKNLKDLVKVSKILKIERQERKKIERELEEAKKAVHVSQRIQSEFITCLNHEIRVPLSGIMGITEIALTSTLAPEQEEYFKTVKTSADSLLNIINNLSDISKIEAGEFDLDECDFLLRNSLDETMKLLTLDAQKKGIGLSCSVEDDTSDAFVGDPWRLRQIVITLMSYTIKAKSSGTVSLKVKTQETYKSATEGNYEISLLQFSVIHTGEIILQKKHNHISDDLSYSHNPNSDEKQYFDLGLALCARLVRLMGGKIWVENENEIDSLFHFAIPFMIQNSNNLKSSVNEPPILLGLPVLVVDSNNANRNMLKDVLTRWGMKLTDAESSDAAVAIVEESRKKGESFSLVILDANLPDMNGFTLAQRLRLYPELSDVTIIMLTFCGQRGDARRCRDMGISAYLTKPFKKAELYEAIIKSLSNGARNAVHPALITRYSLRADRQKLCILLAENDSVNQKLTICMLEKRGHVVVVAKDAQEALQMLDKVVFDLILINLNLPPNMEGLELAHRIREKEIEHIPIIILKDKNNNNSHSLINNSVDGSLSKPLNTKKVFEMIDKVIEEKTEQIAYSNSKENIFDWELPDDLTDNFTVEVTDNVQCTHFDKVP